MIIETERLLLRPSTREDIETLVAMHAHPDVARFMGTLDPAQAQSWIRSNEQDWSERGYGRMTIVERASGRIVGRTGLKHWEQFGETEVGWVLDPAVWGRGYATEAGGGCIDWGFATYELSYITAMIRPDNEHSLAVARRLGMTPLRDDVLMGEPVIVHAVARPE